jgi:hypothetical protein
MKTKITILFLLAICSLNLFSTNFIVTINADAGAGSLRQAITDAIADASVPHTITFGGNYTIALSSALPTINKVMTIDGQANAVIIVGYSSSQNSILNSAALTLENLTFNNLISSYSGNVTATNCTYKNTANAVKVNAVTFSASNCIFDNNTGSANSGASVRTLSSAAIVQLSGCAITNNTGVSAIYHSGGAGSMSIANCTISGNTSTGGAAVYHVGKGTGTLTISNSIISNNTNTSTSVYGGGIGSGATTSIANCQISGNTASRGGGLALLVGTATYKSKLTMTGCTVSGNTLGSYVASAFGGGIYIQGDATLVTDNCSITNCTISGNSTPIISAPVTTSAGGGIQIGGGGSSSWTPVITISNSTIYGNNVQGNPASEISGGGIDRLNGNAVINYCIVIGNNSNSTASGRNITNTASWSTSTTGRNMYEGGASWNSSVTTGNFILTESPTTILNTTLTDNGGTTALPDGSFVKTHALVAACAAINPSMASSGLQTTDQRGIVRSTPDMGAYEYVTYRSKGSGNWGSTSSWQSGDNSTWSDVTVIPTVNAAGSITVLNDHEITVAANATSPSLTINSGGKLSLNAGYTLGITGNFNIQSDATYGTGTYVDKTTNGGLTVTGSNTVNQSLQHPAGALRSWYVSSPVASFDPAGMSTIKYFDESLNNVLPADNWTSTTTMQATKGYMVTPALAANNLLFTGALNNGNQSISITRRAGTDNKPGFNLIGNPYPSYLDWSAVCAYTDGVTPNIDLMPTTTMWYRTKARGSWEFVTVNGAGVSSPLNVVTKYIPPMQAFWVRASNATGTLKLTNTMRFHTDAVNNPSPNLLKAPAAKNTEMTLVRLQVSNGTNTDEAVIYFSENAQNGFDKLDAPKMSNNNVAIPEIYTTIDSEQIVINGMNSIPLDTPIRLGFVAGNASSFSLTANEVSNLPNGVNVILKDNVTKTETDLTDGVSTYQFSPAVTSTDRFSVIFRTPGAVTGLENAQDNSITVYNNAPQLLTVICNDMLNVGSMVSVYNALGQKLLSQKLTGTSTQIAGSFTPGVYVVKVNNTTKKVIIN